MSVDKLLIRAFGVYFMSFGTFSFGKSCCFLILLIAAVRIQHRSSANKTMSGVQLRMHIHCVIEGTTANRRVSVLGDQVVRIVARHFSMNDTVFSWAGIVYDCLAHSIDQIEHLFCA